ncbi:nuclear transport factor 2 family protein [Rhizobium tibeticum]|uniref:nuclear transport factor 2 family protein n=1 Tax=Rhizobium tibeticum TaxID=501024 RepID=UPI0027D7EBC6|nr:nuclear transport factor 2 family protein [Rhizobium tibeticum]
MGSYRRRLFDRQAKAHVRFHDGTRRLQELAEPPDVAFRTTGWFVRKNGDWRQLHHHGSVEDPTVGLFRPSAGRMRSGRRRPSSTEISIQDHWGGSSP